MTSAQALTVMTLAQLRHELKTGRLERMRRSVLRVAGTPESWRQFLLAACLARPGSCASFGAAAALWGLPGFDEGALEITVPSVNRARLENVVVHETRVWGPLHVVTRARVPVTSVARTLCDLSVAVGPGKLGFAVDEALRRKLMTMTTYRRVAADLDGQGRRCCTLTRQVVTDREPGYQPGDSHPEKRIAQLLVDAGLPKPKLQHRLRLGIRTIRLDIAYPEARFGFEYDSFGFHSSRSAFDSDHERDIELELVDWRVPRLTAKTSDAKIVALAIKGLKRAGMLPDPAKNRQNRRV